MDVEDANEIRRITFDRPEVMNAFDLETATALAEAVEATDPSSHDAIVVTGEGPAFSAGGDIQAMAERTEGPRESYERLQGTFGRLTEAMLECRVPTIARVNGDAVGAGLAVVGLCDFAYAIEDATFSCAFVRVGLIPDTGGTFLLPRLVGLRTAKRLAMTGEFFDAERAVTMGLIDGAVPDTDALDERIDGLLETFSNRPSETIGLMKQAIHENLGREWRAASDYENLLQVQAYTTDAHEEGVEAFLEGREPEFD